MGGMKHCTLSSGIRRLKTRMQGSFIINLVSTPAHTGDVRIVSNGGEGVRAAGFCFVSPPDCSGDYPSGQACQTSF